MASTLLNQPNNNGKSPQHTSGTSSSVPLFSASSGRRTSFKSVCPLSWWLNKFQSIILIPSKQRNTSTHKLDTQTIQSPFQGRQDGRGVGIAKVKNKTDIRCLPAILPLKHPPPALCRDAYQGGSQGRFFQTEDQTRPP